MENTELPKENFISTDFKTAITSYGEVLKVGDKVEHEDSEVEESAIITSFEIDTESEEVKAYLDNGKWAHIDFIYIAD